MAKTAVKIVDQKILWDGFNRFIKDAASNTDAVFVGIAEDAYAKPHSGSNATVGEIATFNELGTSRTPARSFIRAPFDIHNGYMRLITSLLRRAAVGTYSLNQVFNILGSSIAKSFIKYVKDNQVEPGDSEETMDRKMSDITLVDTGIMAGSGDNLGHISYKIIK